MAPDGRIDARRDALWAAAAGITALFVYVRTLAPGMVAVADTPMFQFIGRLLGVAHPPGYPLYVFLTWPFSYLPIGSLPYRINLFSALAASITVAMVFLVARRLGGRPIVSLAAALGLAFGPTFWSQATIAEVYTLNSAIVATMLWLLLEWGRTRKPGFFHGAVAVFAAGLGNHTTIVGFAPAIAAYTLLTDRRFALRIQTIATCAVLILAGLLQYGFILIRSHQAGAYVESRATSLAELADVVMARRFGFALFMFDGPTLWNERLPLLVNGILAPEVTVAGLLLAAVGVVISFRRRIAEGLLLLIGFSAIFVFVLNYSADDLPVFLIPAILVTWLYVSVGGEYVVRLAESRVYATGAVAALLLLLPAWSYRSNFDTSDRSRQFEAQVTFDSLIDGLPESSAIVQEDFLTDRMVNLELLGEGAAARRGLEQIPAEPSLLLAKRKDGHRVFAFQRSARSLREQAIEIGFTPYPIFEAPLPAFLSRLSDGVIVAVAVPARHREAFEGSGGASFESIGGEGLIPEARTNTLIGVRGASEGAIVHGGLLDARSQIEQGASIGARFTAPVSIEAWAGDGDAAIRQGGRDLVRSSMGVVVGLWNPDGSQAGTFVLEASHRFRLPRLPGPSSVYEVRGDWSRLELTADSSWNDLANAFRSGTVMMHVPAGVHAVFYVADDLPLASRMLDASPGLEVRVTSFRSGTQELTAAFAGDNFDRSLLRAAGVVDRIELTARSHETGLALLAIGAVPDHAFGRVDGDNGRLALFSLDMTGVLRTPDSVSEVLQMHRDDQAQLMGAGWTAVDSDGVTPYRATTASIARFVLPLQGSTARLFRVQAFSDGRQASTLALRLNDLVLPEQAVRAGWQTYEWTLPAQAVQQGFNDAGIVVGGDAGPSTPSVSVSEVRVIHGEPWTGPGN